MSRPAIRTGVSFFTQEVGSEGTLRIQGQRFSDEEAIKAADRVLVLAEHVVSEDCIRRDPDRNLIPHYMVDAIVECPWGAHPTGCYGLYEPDGRFIQDIYKKTRTQEGLEAWLDEWVFSVSDFDGYLHKLGVPYLKVLKANPAEKHSTLIQLQRGWVDLAFLGGAEIDKYGNVNTTGIGKYGVVPEKRLTGGGGNPDINGLAKKTVFIMVQKKRRFKEHVDYITLPGWRIPKWPEG
jgi:hypothetical protein